MTHPTQNGDNHAMEHAACERVSATWMRLRAVFERCQSDPWRQGTASDPKPWCRRYAYLLPVERGPFALLEPALGLDASVPTMRDLDFRQDRIVGIIGSEGLNR